ncbi:conserved phage C-terminal domain-containing protein [Siminovitchia sediminis]|uniref:Conserved phage C-terminal domain-containing protein n=1 Tax=Siminovitchia sediminis TaxID=1274353 RepID=A0ABW4KIL2_9BACI
MSNLLIQEHPVMIIPSLAVKVGVNEAVVLQQMHYWVKRSTYNRDGRKWVYNTYSQWQEQLPFWSESSLRRTINSLEKKGLVLSAMFNQAKMDQTKWYTLDYEKLDEVIGEDQDGQPPVEGELVSGSILAPEPLSLTRPIPETTTETTTEKIHIPFSEVVDYLNAKTGSSYKPSTRKTRELIRARWNEGFTLEDMKKVIDLKTKEWLHDPHWRNYLRPETLFGTKFESYLNQKPVKKVWREEEFNLDD